MSQATGHHPRAPGRGKYDHKINGPNDLTVKLYNFDVEGDQLMQRFGS
ncbi:MAG: hypothetical protein ABR921_09680 [Candidatus Sulfotelmatobacter sp.]|jgi:hypothetical protein